MRSLKELEQVLSAMLDRAVKHTGDSRLEDLGYGKQFERWERSVLATLMSGPPSAAAAEILGTMASWMPSDLNWLIGHYRECGAEEVAGCLNRLDWEMLDDGCLSLVRIPCEDGAVHYRISQYDSADSLVEGQSLGRLDGLDGNPRTGSGWTCLSLCDRGRIFAHILHGIWRSESPGDFLEPLFQLDELPYDDQLSPELDRLCQGEEKAASDIVGGLWDSFVRRDVGRLAGVRDELLGLLYGDPRLRELASVLLDAFRDLSDIGLYHLQRLLAESPFSFHTQLSWEDGKEGYGDLEALHGICRKAKDTLDAGLPFHVFDLYFNHQSSDGSWQGPKRMERSGMLGQDADFSPEELVRLAYRNNSAAKKPDQVSRFSYCTRLERLVCHELDFRRFMRMLRWLSNPASYRRHETPIGCHYELEKFRLSDNYDARVSEPIDGVVVSYHRYWN